MSDSWPAQETELIARSQRGEQAAYGQLVIRYQRLVWDVALRLGADGGTAQDVAQETFIRAWRALPKFRPQGDASFRAWLCRITHNLTVDALRRRPPEEPAEDVLAAPDYAGGDPAAVFAQQERAERVRAAIRRLPPASQAVLILREYEGLSYGEIAHALDIPTGTVMSRLNYARTRLREMLGERQEQL